MPLETTQPFYYVLHNRLGALRACFETANVRDLIDTVLPSGVPPFQIDFNRSHYWTAIFYPPRVSYRAGRRRHLRGPSLPSIIIRVGDLFDKRQIVAASPVMEARGYLRIAVRNSNEMLVLLLAHELRHLWQFANSPRAAMTFRELVSEAEVRAACGYCPTPEQLAAHRAAETDADLYAKAMLREYRRRIAREISNAIAESPASCAERKWAQLPLQPLLSP